MIDLESEELVSLRDAAVFFPKRRNGKRPSFTCLWRWSTAGVNSAVLETVRVGNCLCTSRAAVARFITAQTQADPRINAGRNGTTSAARAKAAKEADEQLTKAGF